MSAPLYTYTAKELADGYRSGDFTPIEATASVMHRISEYEPLTRAFYTLEPESALRQARESTDRWLKHRPRSALDGIPLSLKENMATAGTPLPHGTAYGRTNPPASEDGPIATRIDRAGGIRIGKTVMPDFGMLSSGVSSLHGITRSPWNREWTVGGSSGGAGAAAAGQMGPVHYGSDIGGSIRLPSTWLGLVGFKPTYGLIPVDSAYIGRAYGPLTRTVTDTALAMNVAVGVDRRDPTQMWDYQLPWRDVVDRVLDDNDIAGLRIAFHLDAGWGLAVAPEVKEIITQAVEHFAKTGAQVEEIAPPARSEDFESLDMFLRARSLSDIRKLQPEQRNQVLPFILDWVEKASTLTNTDVIDAYQGTQRLGVSTLSYTEGYDLVLSPVSPVAAFPAEWPMPSNNPATSLHHIGFCGPYNFSNQPAGSINAGFTEDGRPVGLQIAGKRLNDVKILQVMRWFEGTRPPHASPVWPI